MIKKLIPDYFYKSIYDVPYQELYASGARLLLFDMDNTLISYAEELPSDKLLAYKKELLDMGFELILVSNSRKKRVDKFANAFDIPYVKFSTKPLTRGIRKAIKRVAKCKYEKKQIYLLGDQLMTDIFGGNRAKINTILIDAIDKGTDIGPTRFNRKLERFFLKRIKKKMPKEYEEKLKEYGGEL